MNSSLCLLFLGSSLSLASAANIVLVTDNTGTDASFISHLQGLGHTVFATDQRYRTLDATKLGELNAADLVIISRTTDSGNYAGAGETAQWDSVTSTVWLGSAYLARSSRWGWVDSTAIGGYNGDITAQNATVGAHPLYDGLTPASTNGFAGESKYLFTTGTDLALGSDNLLGDGTVIGVRNNPAFQHIIAAEYEAGGMTGSGNVLGGDRFYFALPTNFGNNNANGLQMIDNTVALLVPEPASGVLLLLGAMVCCSSRRRK